LFFTTAAVETTNAAKYQVVDLHFSKRKGLGGVSEGKYVMS
jgi:hypothetical protein